MSKYPNTFYRVSLKAYIKNEKGEVLVCKENSDTWSLPGGGLDHGEDVLVGLQRELNEEIGPVELLSAEPVFIKGFYTPVKDAWLLWIVFEAKLEDHSFTPGQDVTDIDFVDPSIFKNSDSIPGKLIYEIFQQNKSSNK